MEGADAKKLRNVKIVAGIILIVAVVAVVIGVLINVIFAEKKVELYNIDQVNSGLSSGEVGDLEEFIWQSLKDLQGFDEDKKGIIALVRPSSYIWYEKDGVKSYEFLMDIDEFKATYEVSFALVDGEGFYESPNITCPPSELMKYPETDCQGGEASATAPSVKYSDGMAYLDILVEPIDTKVEIKGREYRNAVYGAEPGTYVATVTREGVSSVEYTLELKENETTGLYLRLADDGTWEQSTAEELAQRNSIDRVMPLYFSICGTPAKRTNCDAISVNYDRVAECGYSQCLIISGRRSEFSEEALTETVKQLSERGYTLDDYKYIYTQNDNR